MNRFLKKAVFALALLVVGTGMAHARDQVKVTGSSTVFPFSSYVAEELGATTKFPAPVVESTGSGGGHKLFGAGMGPGTPTSPTPPAA
jgi:phosphate transport system substrate-binding protein